MAFTEKKFKVDKFNELIGKFDEDEANLEKYYHDLVDSWLQRGKLRYQDYVSWIEDLEDWWLLEEAFFYLSSLYVNSSSSSSSSQTSDLDELKQKISKGEHIFRLIASRSLDVSELLLRKANDMSSSFLTDFNWTVKLATSSDKLARLNEPLCSLRLVKNAAADNTTTTSKEDNHVINQIYHTRNANESITSFEMSRAELKNFIRILENIQTKFDNYEISQQRSEQ